MTSSPRRRPVPRHAAEPVLDPRAAAASAARGVGVPALLAAVVTASAPGWTTYTVRDGDTLSEIAVRHGTSVSALVRANHLPPAGNTVYAGRSLRIPAASSGHGARAGRSSSRRVKVLHTVHTGQNLSTVAARYNTTVAAIMRANGLRSTVVMPGQRLVVGVRGVGVSTGGRSGGATSRNTFAGRTYSDAVVSAAAHNRHRLAARGVPGREQMRGIITRAALNHGVSPSLALAIGWQESGWQQDRVSVANAIGAMQIVPSTGDWISRVVGRHLDLLDAHDNATAGVVLIKVLLNQSTERETIAGYYQGLASVRQNGMFADTKSYVASVSAIRARLR